jgi:hypothetical protein
MSRARLAVPALLAMTLGLAACGGGSSSSSASSSSSSGGKAALSPVAAIQAASDTTSKAGSWRFEQTTVTSVAGKDVSVKASGAFDQARGTGQVTVQLGAQSIEERFLDGSLYLAVPGQTDSFYKVALSDLVGTSLASSTDPTAGFQALKAASSDVTKVGSEQVRDAGTTHYRGTYDAQAALAKVDGAAKQLIQATLDQTGLAKVPFDAWIDAQGRVRRLTQTLDLTTPAAAGAAPQQVHTSTTIEVYDFGTKVDVTAPPAAQVKDGAPLLAAIKGGTGS